MAVFLNTVFNPNVFLCDEDEITTNSLSFLMRRRRRI